MPRGTKSKSIPSLRLAASSPPSSPYNTRLAARRKVSRPLTPPLPSPTATVFSDVAVAKKQEALEEPSPSQEDDASLQKTPQPCFSTLPSSRAPSVARSVHSVHTSRSVGQLHDLNRVHAYTSFGSPGSAAGTLVDAGAFAAPSPCPTLSFSDYINCPTPSYRDPYSPRPHIASGTSNFGDVESTGDHYPTAPTPQYRLYSPYLDDPWPEIPPAIIEHEFQEAFASAPREASPFLYGGSPSAPSEVPVPVRDQSLLSDSHQSNTTSSSFQVAQFLASHPDPQSRTRTREQTPAWNSTWEAPSILQALNRTHPLPGLPSSFSQHRTPSTHSPALMSRSLFSEDEDHRATDGKELLIPGMTRCPNLHCRALIFFTNYEQHLRICSPAVYLTPLTWTEDSSSDM